MIEESRTELNTDYIWASYGIEGGNTKPLNLESKVYLWYNPVQQQVWEVESGEKEREKVTH